MCPESCLGGKLKWESNTHQPNSGRLPPVLRQASSDSTNSSPTSLSIYKIFTVIPSRCVESSSLWTMITVLVTPTFAITSTKPSLAHANSLQLLSRSWRVFFCCLASTCRPVTTSGSYHTKKVSHIISGESCHLVTFWRVSGTKLFGPGENVEMEKLAVSWMILAAGCHCYHPFETSAVWSCKLEWNLEIMFESRHLSDVC